MFPSRDCALLPVEHHRGVLAELLVKRLRAELETRSRQMLAIEMEVEENFGQSAVCAKLHELHANAQYGRPCG